MSFASVMPAAVTPTPPEVTMPIAKSDYPKDWPRIRAQILKRATNADGNQQCECMGECGLHCGRNDMIAHEAVDFRPPVKPRRCVELNGRPALFARGRIVLTIAHLCRKADCPRRDHLKAMCNRCHLRYDERQHYTSRRIRWEREAGQERLFER